ncbi:MAG: glutamate synthase large subunit [Candidatus Omnitrophica bacterium CG11_big_fil_rev_8_21_14_0_20_43_6]|nr:MAG: glutamate synthase large subunit [Candidatus Omnitrophica bacterium CG11_big_fil_rev_8_21_14_0_20_43_6]
MKSTYLPKKQGLYDPQFEHDSCGVGFVCNIKGKKSHDIVKQGLEVLRRLSHRGATGADPKTGDGAGLLIQFPHEFFASICANEKISLPEEGEYASGLVLLPQDVLERKFCKEIFEKTIVSEKQTCLGWRSVPVNSQDIGKTARETQPQIEQIFIGRNKKVNDILSFERKLYIIRKQVENIIRASKIKQTTFFYIPSLSSRTFIYKGLLMPHQVESFFPDLNSKEIKSALALVHSRYSTNTFPTWDLSQPFRFIAHNGEINTLRGNINWMSARQSFLESQLFGSDLKKILPVIVPGGSDSATIDNVFELLTLSGRSLEHAISMLIPAAWEQNNLLSQKVRAFHKYHTCLIEPWDGPAAIVFTDGRSIGAVLDRNGLRPCRYIVTKGDFVVMASEVGVLDIPPSDILYSGRLEPGKTFFIDIRAGRIIEDSQIKNELSQAKPYEKWVKKNIVELDKLPVRPVKKDQSKLLTMQKSFGYTREDLKTIIKPMAENGQEPVGSMGNDTPHAVLSAHPQLLFSYFKQLFAQVTNPPIDPIREELVMSLASYLGPEKNILSDGPSHCHKLLVSRPILTNPEIEKIRKIKNNGFKTKTISLLFNVNSRVDFTKELNKIFKSTESAIKKGYTFIILSDRGVNTDYASIPSLLAVSALHHYLLRRALRTQIGIILESAEPREVNHFALLFGYGVDCVNPYLVFKTLESLAKDKELNLSAEAAKNNYVKAIDKGILKVLSKMGISTLQSYRGAQIFEAVGLNQNVIDNYFSGTVSRINGASLEVIFRETLIRHQGAFPLRPVKENPLASGGVYQWKRDGEFHLWNPESIAALQDAVRNNDPERYLDFVNLINDQSKNPATLRSLLKFKTQKVIPLDEVEPVEEIVKRFATGAMSFGSISRSTHEAIAIAMNRLKGKSNTGEGGEDPARFTPRPNGDSARSAIKQVASGRFGVTTNYLVNADELQIKMAQGAKPGEGGQLPGHKVSAIIAKTRYTTPGVTLISPPPHHDIYSIEDLAQLIFDLKNANPAARISVKLVSEIGVGTVAAGVAKGHADMILISGQDGGTGASPLSSIKHAGVPWELGLSETHQTLVLNDLRSRVRLQTDGQLRTGRDVAIAALLGAEEFGFCTAVLIVLGCVMLRHCNLNNCSVGIATQDEILEKRFSGRPEYIINYFNFIANELRQIMSSLGIRKLEEMVGRVELLELNKEILPWKAKEIDFSRILYKPDVADSVITHYAQKQDHGIDKILDLKLIGLAKAALDKNQNVEINQRIENVNRSTGAMLSGEVCKRFGESGLAEDTIKCNFQGVAGQSFGAFLAKGITFVLEGLANDYVGKGISGGKIIIYPDKQVDYSPGGNIIIGNTSFYGAINGESYIRGVAGERFCIRNSGLNAVVEGVGDHGCEYMTGGRVVILGKTGRNFAAGMSGGIAYCLDESGDFKKRCNLEMVALERINAQDAETIENLLFNHHKYTQSRKAKEILNDFHKYSDLFVKVMPLEYKRILEEKKSVKQADLGEYTDG